MSGVLKKTILKSLFYFTVFKQRFNLKFDKPKKDRCDECDSYKNQNPAEITEEMKRNQESHLKEKVTVRKLKERLKEEAKSKNEVATAAFDLQKILLSPFGKTGSFYYSRRLINYNFTITELDNMSTYCYFWNESECRKGSCEIATAIMQYLIRGSEKGVKIFNLFCDRCGGQNNNRMVLLMLSYVLNNYDIDSISLIFLVSGYSQSENDNAHSAEWEAVIQCSFKRNQCHFHVLEPQDIIDFKSKDAFPQYISVLNDKVEEIMSQEEKAQQQQLNKLLHREKRKVSKVFWSEIRMLKLVSDAPEKIFFKYSFDEDFRPAVFSTSKRNLCRKEMKVSENMQKYQV